MAARTTEQDVLDIMDNALTTVQVTPYLTSANIFVTETLGGTSLSENALTEIERWLTAHFIALSKDRVSTHEEASGALIKYAGMWTTGLEATQYGQNAMMFDTTNTLANLQKGKTSAWTRSVEGN